MKKCMIIGLLLAFANMTYAQGIKFETGLNWEQIKSKAKREHKNIFVDCYATWCGPCKWMSANIFIKKEVGTYFNDHFINIAVQMDQTKNDAEDIKSWYKDATAIGDKFAVIAYPTYLFFTSEGTLTNKLEGTTKDGKEFIKIADFAFNEENRYSDLMANYKTHQRDSAYLRLALTTAIDIKDRRNTYEINELYVNCVQDPFSQSNFKILSELPLSNTRGNWFRICLKNVKKADSLLFNISNNYGKKGMTQRLCLTISREVCDSVFDERNTSIVSLKKVIAEQQNKYPSISNYLKEPINAVFNLTFKNKLLVPKLYDENASQVDWKSLAVTLKNRFIDFDVDRIIGKEKLTYYTVKKLWDGLDEAALAYLSRYGNQLDNEEINNTVWYYIFLHSQNPNTINEALKWSKLTIANYPNVESGYVDTYANLLYKAGKISEAIDWENKAIEIAGGSSSKKTFESTLQKMRNNEKTW